MIRLITDTFRVCLITLLYITVASCSGACTSSGTYKKPIIHNFPVKSFVQLRSDTAWKGCELDKEYYDKILDRINNQKKLENFM